MNNDLQIGSIDNDHINIHEYYEVEHWTKELHTNVEALKLAVEQVGTSIADIKNYLDHK
jgi:antitoxin component HigA of HigAB toxin-antitoxin module